MTKSQVGKAQRLLLMWLIVSPKLNQALFLVILMMHINAIHILFSLTVCIYIFIDRTRKGNKSGHC